jgi:hypothetical protein
LRLAGVVGVVRDGASLPEDDEDGFSDTSSFRPGYAANLALSPIPALDTISPSRSRRS